MSYKQNFVHNFKTKPVRILYVKDNITVYVYTIFFIIYKKINEVNYFFIKY